MISILFIISDLSSTNKILIKQLNNNFQLFVEENNLKFIGFYLIISFQKFYPQ